MEKIEIALPENEITKELEKAYYEKNAYENLISYAMNSKMPYNYLMEKYLEALKIYDEKRDIFTEKIIQPLQENNDDYKPFEHWNIQFGKKVIVLE